MLDNPKRKKPNQIAIKWRVARRSNALTRKHLVNQLADKRAISAQRIDIIFFDRLAIDTFHPIFYVGLAKTSRFLSGYFKTIDRFFKFRLLPKQ
jgi:hypothetical protein